MCNVVMSIYYIKDINSSEGVRVGGPRTGVLIENTPFLHFTLRGVCVNLCAFRQERAEW